MLLVAFDLNCDKHVYTLNIKNDMTLGEIRSMVANDFETVDSEVKLITSKGEVDYSQNYIDLALSSEEIRAYVHQIKRKIVPTCEYRNEWNWNVEKLVAVSAAFSTFLLLWII